MIVIEDDGIPIHLRVTNIITVGQRITRVIDLASPVVTGLQVSSSAACIFLFVPDI